MLAGLFVIMLIVIYAVILFDKYIYRGRWDK